MKLFGGSITYGDRSQFRAMTSNNTILVMSRNLPKTVDLHFASVYLKWPFVEHVGLVLVGFDGFKELLWTAFTTWKESPSWIITVCKQRHIAGAWSNSGVELSSHATPSIYRQSSASFHSKRELIFIYSLIMLFFVNLC